MKKLYKLLLLVAVVSMAFTSCAKNDDKDNTKQEEKTEQKTEQKSEEKQEEKKEEASNKEVDRKIFVDPQYVKDVIDGKSDVKDYVLVEATWGEAKDSPDYLKGNGHIKGAIHVNTDSVEVGPVWNLRKPEEIEKALLSQGITKDKTVIVYGPDTGATRVAFTYMYAGVEHVKILNGGIKAWKDKGFETETTENKPVAATDFGTKIPAHPEYLISLDQAKDKLENDKNFQLISIRSEKEWKGIESGYSYIPKAGEPKGALWGKSGKDNSDMSYYTNPDGTYKSFDEVKKMWEEQGISTDKEMSFYCGTGWRATLPWFMAFENGLNPTIFDGGWNEWQMHKELPVQVGDPKDKDVQFTTVDKLPNDRATK